ncbi:MAG: type II toxin-antitoxin system Phd/YefM family antitoxin [Glycocaulis sp.]
MRTFTAADAKNRFGELLDTARREPVRIEKHGRAVAVMVSEEDYALLQQLKREAVLEQIAEGQAAADAGQMIEGEALFARLQEKLTRGAA